MRKTIVRLPGERAPASDPYEVTQQIFTATREQPIIEPNRRQRRYGKKGKR